MFSLYIYLLKSVFFFSLIFLVISYLLFFSLVKVLETERRIYLVTEYASGGEIFGKYSEMLFCVY